MSEPQRPFPSLVHEPYGQAYLQIPSTGTRTDYVHAIRRVVYDNTTNSPTTPEERLLAADALTEFALCTLTTPGSKVTEHVLEQAAEHLATAATATVAEAHAIVTEKQATVVMLQSLAYPGSTTKLAEALYEYGDAVTGALAQNTQAYLAGCTPEERRSEGGGHLAGTIYRQFGAVCILELLDPSSDEVTVAIPAPLRIASAMGDQTLREKGQNPASNTVIVTYNTSKQMATIVEPTAVSSAKEAFRRQVHPGVVDLNRQNLGLREDGLPLLGQGQIIAAATPYYARTQRQQNLVDNCARTIEGARARAHEYRGIAPVRRLPSIFHR